MKKLISVSFAALSLAGCVSQSPNSGFDHVQKMVHERAGQEIFWNTSSDEDSRADAAVDRLLKPDLTPDAAVQIALLNNRQLQATFEDLGIAQADLVRAGLLKNPVFNGAYEFASGGGLAKVNLSVTEDFLSVLQIPLKTRVAAAALEAAQLKAADAVLDLAADTRAALYDYQSAQQVGVLRQSAAAAKKASADAADRFHQAGNMSDLDLANAQAMAGQASLAAAEAAADRVDKRETLNDLMGLSQDRASDWKVAATLPDVPSTQPAFKGLETFAINQRLDLAAARRTVAATAGDLGIAKQFALLSDASAGASAEREHEGLWETGPEISVPIPLFDFGGASVAGARARMRQAQRRYEAMATEVQSQVRRAQSKMGNAIETSRCYRETILPSRQQIVDQTMLRYNGMLASVFQVLAAKDAQLDAQAGAIMAARDYWIASAQLERAVGGKLP